MWGFILMNKISYRTLLYNQLVTKEDKNDLYLLSIQFLTEDQAKQILIDAELIGNE